jgi:hypothetical protein
LAISEGARGDEAKMHRTLALLLAAVALWLPQTAALAQSGARVVSTVTWVEEWDPASGQWVPVDETPAAIAPAVFEPSDPVAAEPVRFIARPARMAAGAALARFGPFRVLDDRRATLIDGTDESSPQAFAAMLAAHPELEVIEFADAPGTSHDLANLALGRAIRAAGLATHVPTGGSARSGAVELFLAGTRRTVDPGALFAVHSWRDESGREPDDFAPDAPENRLYLDYYAEMGMSAEEARAFYAMTNSVPHASALWLEGAQMARWIAPEAASQRPPAKRELAPQLASGLQLAILRSGAALAQAARAPLTLPRFSFTGYKIVPQLAYADAGLLDSRTAFP